MTEQQIQQKILLECHKHHLTLFRNNTGLLYNKRGDPVKYGLCKGSSDLIGWHNRTGAFTAIEVKTEKGRPTKEQERFIENVRKSGGIAFVARSIDDLVREMDAYNKNLPCL